MKKFQIYGLIALALLVVFFTIPIVGFYGAANKIKDHDLENIPNYAYAIWDIYSPLQYKKRGIDQGKNLKEKLELHEEVGMASIPVWRVSLEAPNYPKATFPDGIPVNFHFDGFSAEVHEMNTINHYIGMYPMERGAQVEMTLMPYIFLFTTLLLILFLNARGKTAALLALPAVLLPVGFLVDFTAWLYWFGHNMQEWGAFKIKPFMPTAFGEGKVAQFTTHSYPTIGFFVLLVISALCILAMLSKIKYEKESKRA